MLVIVYCRCVRYSIGVSDEATNSAHNGVIKVDPFLMGAVVTNGGIMPSVVCHNCLEGVYTCLGIVS